MASTWKLSDGNEKSESENGRQTGLYLVQR